MTEVHVLIYDILIKAQFFIGKTHISVFRYMEEHFWKKIYIYLFLNFFSMKQLLFLVHTGMYYILTSDLSEHEYCCLFCNL